MGTLSYGLNINKKGPPPKTVPAKRKPIFDEDDLDEDEERSTGNGAIVEISTLEDVTSEDQASKSVKRDPGNSSTQSKKPRVSLYGDLSTARVADKHSKEATSLDPSIYDYDAAFDSLQAASLKKKAEQAEDAATRKPKYMSNLLAAAEVRKRDQLRAKEKLLAKEREAEGDEYDDKEKFVTGAYKAQQEEVKKLEEEERLREEEEEKRRKGKGMTNFYRSVLEKDEKRHEEAVAAASEIKAGDIQKKDEEPSKERSEAEIARELKAQGRDVTINDEGQVVDKRQLLSAGLNVAPKPRPSQSKAGLHNTGRPPAQPGSQNKTASQRAMRERQSRMLEEQLDKASEQAAAEEAEKKAALEKTAKSKKTDGEVSSARERYLQRKKEAEAQKAKEAA
ncbi:MAG: hypothetical protein M1823_002698 [Watsoniomyces obsoletus]|nr:MAG: hypothetical protein M1823_002698 [Watsoniomyces obsoletus]